MQLLKDPVSNLILPKKFVDEKQALKKVIDDLVDEVVLSHQHLKDTYYLTIHAKFNPLNPSEFQISKPVITFRLPPFIGNTFVFFVSNKRSICEILWMIPPKRPGEKKLKVEFNTKGVAYLQAKGAMPKETG